jgi:hypothetical protein
MGSYWRTLLAEGWWAYCARIKGGLRSMIVFLVQTTFLLALLYMAPWLGVLQDEAKLITATLGAVLISGLLTFVWELIRAPVSLHNRIMVRLEDACEALELRADAEAIRSEMFDLCRSGRLLLTSGAIESEKIDAWKCTVLPVLRENYESNFLYEFENETSHFGVPKNDFDRLQRLVQNLEQTAMSWGSRAERAQERLSALLPEAIPSPRKVSTRES